MTTAIAAHGLRKSFGERHVLDGLDLSVPAGSVLALLGPNGSGKTTTVRILTTLIRADGRQATVAGHDIANDVAGVRRSIGVTGQFAAVDTQFSGRENLRIMVDLARIPRGRAAARVDELLAEFDLTEAADRPAETYSGGMLRRLDVAMTLVRRPEVLFLDEPTTGLDPRSRRAVWAQVRALVDDGVTVLLTTQYLEEADQLADRIALLDGGRIVAEGTSADLKAQVRGVTDPTLDDVFLALTGHTTAPATQDHLEETR